ncbi:hypothetical protein [Paenibacillus sp.]|jgi:hypothetical protein|uniref:hypothetical protein n=1 Tax=Paenibacillus sp. TaxID=58172 RepID=UPI00282B5764|nr:hypothetical protein [Paenibacillus sp.]MDR0269625.1 hypothetical protein [Paenibacillus sp.]
MNELEKKRLLKSAFKSLKNEKSFFGSPVTGGEIQELFPSDLIDIKEGPHETVILKMQQGDYYQIPSVKDPDEFFGQFSGFVKVSSEGAVNVSKITRIDPLNRLIWCEGKNFKVENDYWDNLIREYNKHSRQ